MLLKYFLHLAPTITLLMTGFSASLSNVAFPLQTQDAAPAVDSPDLVARLAAIEKAIDARRRQLGIPGVSLVIVKDDKVIYLKGLGLKNIERNLPVTPDTLFAIGSAGKAFTAMSVVMTADEAKLSLDDSPKKFLPYFKLRDPEADSKITIRDLLCHRSGLNSTSDMVSRSSALSREELIQVAAMAKPTAKLREKFQYQNVMYAAAGEIVAKAQKTTWEDFIVTRILKPLGMKASTLTVKDMEKSPDYSYGYEHDFVTKETRQLPMQDLPSVATAGRINSSARDMAAWLRLMLGDGMFEGKRFISEKGFNELISPQMRFSDRGNYGLGWRLIDWHGHKTIYHGGNDVGFNSMVALMPDQKLGFAFLSNVSSAPLSDEAIEIIWSNLVGAPEAIARAGAGAAPSPETESVVGDFPEKYKELLATYEVNGRFAEIVARGDKPALFVTGQRPYPLIEKEKDSFAWAGRPPEYCLEVKRGADGKVTGIVVKQPNRTFELKRVAEPAISVDELMSKVIAAAGGEANLLKHTSMVTTATVDFENQGVTGEATISAKAPNLSATDLTLMALGKKIGAMREYFDGARGAQEESFAPAQIKAGKSLEAARIEADFYGLLNWKKLFKDVAVKRMSKVGDEDVYVVVKTPEKADPITDYISAKSFLLLKRETTDSRSTSMVEQPATAIYSDYRMVDGRMIPFRIAHNTLDLGDVVVRVKEVKFDVSLPDSVFRSQARK
jgi:CubicO group peptidase (beta-lactamase class C family)